MLLITHMKNLMPMISSEGENSPGTVYYGVAMSVMAVLSCFAKDYVFAFGIAVFCTSIGDGFAAVTGSLVKRCNPKIYKNKTLFGTLAAAVLSFASAYAFTLIYSLPISVAECLYIGLFAAGLELVTGLGLDNIVLPFGVSMLSHFLMFFDPITNYIVPILATPFIIALVLEKKLLTPLGVGVAVVLDIAVSLSFGNFGFVLLLAFLLLSVVVDKIKKCLKKSSDEISKRGDHRDEIQVIANGLVPMFMALAYLVSGDKIFILAYTASLAECFADTCASGFGMLAASAFDPFRMKRVPVGLSGGMSWLGTLASFVAAAVFPLIAFCFGVLNISECLIASAAAAVGTLVDSMSGSLVQVKYKCAICGIITEKNEHCGTETQRISGFSFVSNDVVNVVSAAFTVLVSALIYILV
jgi:uncharacterized protein (TIGR00297 family)